MRLLMLKHAMAAAVLLIATTTATAQESRTAAPEARALRAVPGEVSLYELSFVTRDTMPAKCEFVIEFPAAMDLSLLQVASSTTINGGFELVREQNRVRVIRTGLGEVVLPGKKVEIKLGIVKNPPDLNSSFDLAFEIRDTSQQTLAAKQTAPIKFTKPVAAE